MNKYFKASEYRCKCGCGIANMAESFLAKLDELREDFGAPLVINSGCRCARHNSAVGGAPHSLHISTVAQPSCAVDLVRPAGDCNVYRLIKKAMELGLSVRIGANFIHLDDRTELREMPAVFGTYYA